jgi:hypothetical protein
MKYIRWHTYLLTVFFFDERQQSYEMVSQGNVDESICLIDETTTSCVSNDLLNFKGKTLPIDVIDIANTKQTGEILPLINQSLFNSTASMPPVVAISSTILLET